jgi:lysophospholipase L1-like esterase
MQRAAPPGAPPPRGNPLPRHSAVIPVPRLEDDFYDWHERHAAKKREAAAAEHPVIFIGDSITHLFEGHPGMPDHGDRLWRGEMARYRPLNLGFGWDRTQNVLYRLADGELDNQRPRLVVLAIGTNNLTGTQNAPTNTPEEVRDGVAAVCRLLRERCPGSRILLMAVLPRGAPEDPLRDAVRRTNALLAGAASSLENSCFLDIGDRFLDDAGRIPTTLMADLVHPTEAGYRIWLEALKPHLEAAIREA